MAKNASVLRIRQVRGRIGQRRKQREALQTLGLHRIGQVVERPDNPAVRGTVRAIAHLVRVEGDDVVVAAPKPKPTKAAAKVEKPKPAEAAVEAEKQKKAETAAVAETAPKTAKKKTKKKAAKKTAAKKTTKKKAKTAKKKKKASGGKS